MKGWKAWLALAAALYAFFLLWTIPAGLGWSWLAARPGSKAAGVTMVDLHGPWTAGNCKLLRFGPLQLQDLSWRLRPLGLLKGRLEFALAAGLPGGGKASATLSLGRRNLELKDLQWHGPAAPLMSRFFPGVDLRGSLEGQDLHLLLAGGLPVEAKGQLVWRGAGLDLAQPLDLGELAMHLKNEADGIVTTIKDAGGPLRLELQARVKADGTYQLDGEIAPRGNLQPGLRNLLGLLGPPAPDGRVRLNRAGRLAPLY